MMLGPRTFRFLNEARELSWPTGWTDPSIDRLWLFNLHYFEDLAAEDAPCRKTWHKHLLARWIDDNMRGFTGPAWLPYVTSVRIVNWIKWALAGGELSRPAIASLAVQVRYLRQRLETHLLGNHLLVNAKALLFAGLFFEGDEAQRWFATGQRIVKQQLARQILADGGHCELSPMYHALVLEDLLDLLNLFRAYPDAPQWRYSNLPVLLKDTIQPMRRWLWAMTLPDGEIALFNDAAWSIAATPGQLDGYASRLALPSVARPSEGITHLSASGYARLALGPAVAIVDVGEIGASYVPGHGHADVLTFELALFGRRVIVNSGTSVYYGNDVERLRQRQTAAHNTVTIDDQDSSEVWDNFRVARRARPTQRAVEEEPDGTLMVAACHDGYRRLPGQVMHRRRWRLRPDRLDIQDDLSGSWRSAVARFHLHPALRVAAVGDYVELGFAGHRLLWKANNARINIERSSFHPEFGLSLSNRCLAAEMTGSRASHQFGWC
jgi:uncharacterized heparinase superfamily protein